MTAFPKPTRKAKAEPRWRRPHRFEEAHDDPAPATLCWGCLRPRDHRIHRRGPGLPAKKARGASRRATTASFAFPRPEAPPGGRKRRSAHARRPRAWGKMAFLRNLGCDVRAALIELANETQVDQPPILWDDALAALPPCRGATQVMHLGWKADPGGRRQAHDADTDGGCEGHHAGMGTKLGGLDPWYVALGREGQRILRRCLQDRGQAAWDALSQEERDRWDRDAAIRA